MRRSLPTRLIWTASFALAIACSLDNRTPGVLDEDAAEFGNPAPVAGDGGAPGVVEPAPPSGGAPARDAIAAAGSGVAGNSMVSVPGAGGLPNESGGTAGSAMVPVGGAGGTTVAAGGSAAVGLGNSSLVLSPVEGWVDGQSNAAGVQGGLFYEVDSSAGGPSSLGFVSSGPAVCVEGIAGPVRDTDYGRDWGAQFGLGLGQPSPNETGGWSQTTPVGQLTGFTFTLTGTEIPPESLRFIVEDSAGTSYCAQLVGSSGTFSIPITELTVACWQPGGTPLTPELLLSAVSWGIYSNVSGPVPFDFCVENLTVDVQ